MRRGKATTTPSCPMMTTPLHHSLLSHQSTCHLRSDSSFSTGDLQYPLAGPHLLSLMVRIPQFQQEAPPSVETTINPRLLSLPICHSMQCTSCTPPTTPSPMSLTTPLRTPSPAPHQKSTTPPLAQTPYQSCHDHSWRASTLWDRYIRTQGLMIPDPLYQSPGPHRRVKKPRCYAATPEERHHQEQMALLDQPTNGQRLTQGLLGKIMDQDRKSRRGTHSTKVPTTSPSTFISQAAK